MSECGETKNPIVGLKDIISKEIKQKAIPFQIIWFF